MEETILLAKMTDQDVDSAHWLPKQKNRPLTVNHLL
jgi:hypothetical protein